MNLVPPPDAIPYSVAIKRESKTEFVCWTTPVDWYGAPENKITICFKTIGKKSIPQLPSLPRGYKMKPHPAWYKLEKELKSFFKKNADSLSFDQLDDFIRDLNFLESLIGDIEWDWSEIYEIRKDYCEWVNSFEDAWGDLESALKNYMETTIKQVLPPHKEPQAWQPDGIGNRTMPPSPEEVFTKLQQLIAADTPETLKKLIEVAESER